MDYIIQHVFELPLDGPLALALARAGHKTFQDLRDLSAVNIASLLYPEGNVLKPLSVDDKYLLLSLLGYINYRMFDLEEHGVTPIDSYNCMKITADEFWEYMESSHCSGYFDICY